MVSAKVGKPVDIKDITLVGQPTATLDIIQQKYEQYFDPSSLNLAQTEGTVTEENQLVRGCRLDEIVERIEKPDSNNAWPRRVR